MPKLHGRKIFKMSPHGFAPLDVVYDAVWGGNVSAAAAAETMAEKAAGLEKPLEEMTDAEWERHLSAIHSAGEEL